jgi:nitroreductase
VPAQARRRAVSTSADEFPRNGYRLPMDTWDTITSRRQVRSFTPDSIPMGELEQILEAGRRAPSARNGQRWDFIVVTDKEQMERLSHVWRGAGWTAGAAATIALVMPESEGPEALTDWFDLGQAAMQMMIAATGFGIASGQASCRDQELAQEVLGFPDGKQCLLLIALGYAADRPLKPIRKPSRREFDDVVHYGTW